MVDYECITTHKIHTTTHPKTEYQVASTWNEGSAVLDNAQDKPYMNAYETPTVSALSEPSTLGVIID